MAPTPLDRARVVEMVQRLEPAMKVIAAATVVAALAAVLEGGYWGLLPLFVGMATAPLIGPRLRSRARPECSDALQGLLVMVSLGAGAGLTGGADSPLVFLIPVGAVVGASRSRPLVTTLITAITMTVFIGTYFLVSGPIAGTELLHLLAFVAALAAVAIVSHALTRAETESRRASILDPLTGLLNRGALDGRFEELRQQAVATGAHISVVLFDLDRFKSVNDQHGHVMGDNVLRDVAYRVRKTLRRFELLYRVGGEEFLLVLPGLDEREATEVAEQVRAVIAGAPVVGLDVTASFGVSAACGDAVALADLYRRADSAMYVAKREGRDAVRAATATHGRRAAPAPAG